VARYTVRDFRMPSDREQLLEMGFDSEKVDMALKKTGGCTACHESSHRIHTDKSPSQWRTRSTGWIRTPTSPSPTSMPPT
jgi:hypothetical protein